MESHGANSNTTLSPALSNTKRKSVTNNGSSMGKEMKGIVLLKQIINGLHNNKPKLKCYNFRRGDTCAWGCRKAKKVYCHPNSNSLLIPVLT